jgi:hypothetical protein
MANPATKAAPPVLMTEDYSPMGRTSESALDGVCTTPTGTYSITWKEVPVNAQESRHSEVVGKVVMGARVRVLEVSDALDQGRVRARIADPPGWISLRYDKNESIFAIKVQDSPTHSPSKPAYDLFSSSSPAPAVASRSLPNTEQEDGGERTMTRRPSIGEPLPEMRDLAEDDLLKHSHASSGGTSEHGGINLSPLNLPGAPPLQLPVGGATQDLPPAAPVPPPELPDDDPQSPSSRRRTSNRLSELVPIREDAVLEGSAAIPIFALVPPQGMASPTWADEVVTEDNSPNKETGFCLPKAESEDAATKIQAKFRGRTMHKRYEAAKATLIPKVEQAQCLCWDVHLIKKASNQRYGFSHTSGKDEFNKARAGATQATEEGPSTLFVKQVRPDGLLYIWNKEHPDAAVLPFDRVAEVNGKKGVEEMQNELRAPSVLLRVVRYPGNFEVDITRDTAEQKLGIKFEKPTGDDASAPLKDASISSGSNRPVDELRVVGLMPQGLLEELNKKHMAEGLYQFVVTNGMYVSGANGIANWEDVARRLRQFSTAPPIGENKSMRLTIRRNDPWVEEQQQKSEQAKKDILIRGLKGTPPPKEKDVRDDQEEV